MEKDTILEELSQHGIEIQSELTLEELNSILFAVKKGVIDDEKTLRGEIRNKIKAKMNSDMGGSLTDGSLDDLARDIIKLIQ